MWKPRAVVAETLKLITETWNKIYYSLTLVRNFKPSLQNMLTDFFQTLDIVNIVRARNTNVKVTFHHVDNNDSKTKFV